MSKRGMYAWNRLTGQRVKEWGSWMKEGEEIAKEHVCIVHRHRQQCGDGLGERDQGQKWREWGTSIIVSTMKKKKRGRDKHHLIKKKKQRKLYLF